MAVGRRFDLTMMCAYWKSSPGIGIRMNTRTEDYYPDHDGGKFAPIAATTVATWKAPAFLENLAIDAEGAVFVTVHSHKRIDRYDPATGATTTFAEFAAPPMGLAFDAGGVLWVTGGTLYELNPADGTVQSQISISEGLPHFSSLSLAGGTGFVGTLDGVVAISGA